MRQYVQSDLEADPQVATALAGLIIGGCSRRFRCPPRREPMAAMTPSDQHPVYKSVY
jgi:hypothetical protein